MYYDNIAVSNFAGCTYFQANNPSLGNFEVDVGMVTQYSMTTGSYSGNQNVSLNSNCFMNQKVAAVASQHNNVIVGEVQPHHQCPYFDYHRSQSRTYTNSCAWCTLMFTNRYWQDTAKGSTSHLVFISDGGKLKKFCFWNTFSDNGRVEITDCTDVEVGYLEIIYTSVIPVL